MGQSGHMLEEDEFMEMRALEIGEQCMAHECTATATVEGRYKSCDRVTYWCAEHGSL